MIRRREFMTLLGGTAAAWPLGARAQQAVVGFLHSGSQQEWTYAVAAFQGGLKEAGFVADQNLRIEFRWAQDQYDRLPALAADLVARNPSVVFAGGGSLAALAAKRATSAIPVVFAIGADPVKMGLVAHGTSTVRPLLMATRTVPIVFPIAADPVGAGLVESLARPSGNATGFMTFEYSLSGKWLELLKQIAPGTTRVAVLRDASQGGGTALFAAIQAVAPSLQVEVIPVNMRAADEIERAIAGFARLPNGGLVVTAGAASVVHRDLILALEARYKLPAVYYERFFAVAGGLMSYGPDRIDQYRRAAGYVDRILKGEKPADLPVQAPTKYETVINLKTAKALGLEVPPTLLARADEVIE